MYKLSQTEFNKHKGKLLIIVGVFSVYCVDF